MKKIKTFRGEKEQYFMDRSRQLAENEGKKYREEYIKVCEKTGVKDGKNFKMVGDPKIGAQVPECIPTEIDKRREDVEKLDKKFEAFLKERDDLDQKYREMLESEETIELWGIKEEHLPKDFLLPNEIEILLDFIEEEGNDGKQSQLKKSTEG